MRISSRFPSLFATVALALAPLVCEAATSVTIDAKQNCLTNILTTGVSGATPAQFTLAPGRYVMSLTSNTMSCVLAGVCPINSVLVQGGNANAMFGISIQQPTIVDVNNAAPTTFFAFVSDDVCSDNHGTATLLIQTVN